MITLSIGKLLENNGFGKLLVLGTETNPSIFVEQITIGTNNQSRNGLWLESRGYPVSRGTRTTSIFDIYARTTSPFLSYNKLEDVLTYLKNSYGEVCDLPVIAGVDTKQYINVAIQPTSNIENVGQDAEGRMVFVISAQVSYEITNI
ncbi:MAG TPA: hypothetical protein VL020_04660 [Pseudomonadales bacterium]|nr:hypothetical protein [Pseudomonadales bacterium]